MEKVVNFIKNKEIMTKYFLSTVRVTFPKGDGILHQELVPCYISKLTQKYFEKTTSVFWNGVAIPQTLISIENV